MLTIKIYRGVPFQSNYNNVILFNSQTNLNTYLETYLAGTISNIAIFFDGNNEIVLQDLYENSNYMQIYDTNSIMPYKYYFIDNAEFVSGGGVKYKLILDVWATYQYYINLKDSRLICGHVDALTDYNFIKRELIYNEADDITQNLLNSKFLTPKWADAQNASIVALVQTQGGSFFFTCQAQSEEDLYYIINKISLNRYYLKQGHPTPPPFTDWTTFEMTKLFIVNGFNLYDYLVNNFYFTMDEIEVGDLSSEIKFYAFFSSSAVYHEDAPVYENFLSIIINQFNLFSNSTFTDKTNKLKYKYKVGTPLTNQEINITSETNPLITLEMQISRQQILIYIVYGDTKLNVSNDFEIPFVNDSYQLYLAQNQATIDANNKANAISLATALATATASVALLPMSAGASAMVGVGAITSAVNYGVNNLKSEASLNDAKSKIDRIDGNYCAGMYTLLYGCGAFTYMYKNYEATNNILNKYGTKQKYYTSVFKPQNTTLFNFYFVQYDDINLYGNFNNNIKNILMSIFQNGVRIWCDSAQFLNNVNYKK